MKTVTIETIQAIATAHNMVISPCTYSAHCEVQSIKGIVNDRSIYIYINYTNHTVRFRDQLTKQENCFFLENTASA